MKHCEPNEIARKIIEAFPRKHNEKDPFKVLVSTILSQRTRDENTDEASRRLFARYKDPMSIAKADPEELYELIRPAGMYRQKAERIIMVAKQLLERYQGKVPSELHKLLDLPGVGRKTANIVEKLWGPINGSMVEFGRRLCKPRNPMCDECPVKACCALYLSSETH